MIIVAGTMTFDPALLEEFARDVAAMRPKVLTEAGCLHYSLLIEDAAAGLVNVYERWESQDALMVHFTQPWIAEFFAKYGPQLKGSTVEVFDVAGVRPLPQL